MRSPFLSKFSLLEITETCWRKNKEFPHLFLLLLFFFPCLRETKTEVRESNIELVLPAIHYSSHAIHDSRVILIIHYFIPAAVTWWRASGRCRRAWCRRWRCGRRPSCRPGGGCGRERSWRAATRCPPLGHFADRWICVKMSRHLEWFAPFLSWPDSQKVGILNMNHDSLTHESIIYSREPGIFSQFFS